MNRLFRTPAGKDFVSCRVKSNCCRGLIGLTVDDRDRLYPESQTRAHSSMLGNPPDDETGILSEETLFWRDFIQWWAREKDEPVPQRAWEALAYAEAKQDSNLPEVYCTSDS